jgi:anti-sigma regulatory factor (Ser/Thr protein kinase)
MRPNDTAATPLPRADGDRPLLDTGATRLAHELVRCRGKCRRQELTIDGLTRTLTALRRGAMALKAENAELRAELNVLHRPHAAARHVDVTLPVGPEAPATARAALARALTGHVTEETLADAQLVVSELVTNSVRHAGVPAGVALQVSAHMVDGALRLEVDDPGGAGIIAPRDPDFEDGGGFGLQIVHTLAKRWGVSQDDGTRIWVELASAQAIV